MKVEFIDATESEKMSDSIVSDGENYDVFSAAIIRYTDGFPSDRIVYTPEHAKVVMKDFPTGMHYIIIDMLRQQYGDDYEKYLEDFKIAQIEKRHTIHFCINGIVSSHEYGNFDNRKYVIIDPLCYHIDKVKSLRAEDTYFTDDIVLSPEAAIVMSKKTYEESKNDPSFEKDCEDYRVFVYEGDLVLAVQKTLNKLGYDSFIIGKHGYKNAVNNINPAYKMFKMLCNLADEKNISLDRHFNSEDARVDLDKIIEDNVEIESVIIDEMISSLGEDESLGKYLKRELDTSMHSKEYTEKLTNLIKRFGLDNLSKEIKKCNDDFYEKLNTSKRTI